MSQPIESVAGARGTVELRYASEEDVPLLAELNRQLIQDEHASNPMSLAELTTRMRAWLRREYRAVVFEQASEPVAYALFRTSEEDLYLRQFFVSRGHRRRGVGRRAIGLFREQVVPPGQAVALEVLAHNAGGIAFWRALGFREHAFSFRLGPPATGTAGREEPDR